VEKYSYNESSQKKHKQKHSSHEDNDKTKKIKKKVVGVKKKRRRKKPAIQNSPITYIKLPAQPYSFVKTEGPTSSIYSPKSSSSSYFDQNPLQALFKGLIGEADKSGRTIFTPKYWIFMYFALINCI
jgi:hypothetical protein